jgi:hypothetical protein
LEAKKVEFLIEYLFLLSLLDSEKSRVMIDSWGWGWGVLLLNPLEVTLCLHSLGMFHGLKGAQRLIRMSYALNCLNN